MPDPLSPLVSCEHGGNRIPPQYRAHFTDHDEILGSHRGWDPGALQLATALAETLEVPLYATRISRLLVEMNRTVGHRDLFSPFSRALSLAERETVLSRYYWPHWRAIAREVARIAEGGGIVLHLAIHTFTPVLDGKLRDLEMGILYDPGREREKAFARQWRSDLRKALPEATSGIRIRFNRPYRGTSDGLSTWLRKRFSAESYLGVEVEVSQGVIQGGGRRWATLRSAILTSLGERLPPALRHR